MEITPNTLLKRASDAWTTKQQWNGLYESAYSLALPQRNKQSQGAAKNETVYDSTLQQATVKLAGTLQTTITPPFTKWAKLVPGAFITEDVEEAAKKLETISDIIFAAMQPSNFDIAAGEFFLDLIIGTGAMLVLEGDDVNPFKFIAVPIAEIALEEGGDSMIGGIFRKYKKPARTIPSMWPDHEKNQELLNLIADDPGREVAINEMTYFDYEDDVWRYAIVLDKINDEPVFFVERKYDANPWIISRWIKCSGETFGRGPVLNALPDAKTANMAKKLELQNASLAIAGVWMARNNGVLNGNAIRIQPGAVIPVMSTGGAQGADLQRLDVGGDLQYSQIIMADLRQSIKDAMFDRSIPDQGAVRSATEWIARSQELAEAIGSPFGRLHQEFIRPLFKRLLDILHKKGLIEKIPLDGTTVDVKITGTLAQAQQMKEVESLQNWGLISQELAGPEAWQASAKIEGITRKVGNLLGVTPELLRSEEEQQQIAQAAAQAMAQQQQGEPTE